MTTRRSFLESVVAIAGATAMPLQLAEASRPLDVLILGGTGFIGPHMVEYALARGHRLTLFNRGKRQPGPYADKVEVLTGDRDTRTSPGLAALQGSRRWDVVIDNSGYVPRHVQDSIELLRTRVGRYIYVSTVAVYDTDGTGTYDERSPLRAAPDGTEAVTRESYGALKAECDRVVQREMGHRATIVRPIYIVGPGDETDRFTYWVQRVARGGTVLGPPDPTEEIQWIDVRDLCPWIVQLAERDQAGIYNAAGPVVPMNWKQMLGELAAELNPRTEFAWPTEAVLDEIGLQLPLAWPRFFAGRGTPHFTGTAAQAAGLRYRSLRDTASATLSWWRDQPAERRAAAKNWPTPEQEARALELIRGTRGQAQGPDQGVT